MEAWLDMRVIRIPRPKLLSAAITASAAVSAVASVSSVVTGAVRAAADGVTRADGDLSATTVAYCRLNGANSLEGGDDEEHN